MPTSRGAVSVAIRVIPCLDVDAGRVVKGVNFVELRDAGAEGRGDSRVVAAVVFAGG